MRIQPVKIKLRFFPTTQNPSEIIMSISEEKPAKLAIPEDSTLRRHFLTQLRAVVEAEVLPASMDSSLSHYYEATVAAEYQKRLAA